MACSPVDVVCNIEAALMPFVVTIGLVIVLFFVGAFGGRTGKGIAILGVLVIFLWWIGLEWLGIPLAPIRSYFGQAVTFTLGSVVQ